MSDDYTKKETADIEAPEPHAKSHCCPANGKTYASVKRKTLLHHILHPRVTTISEQEYYFCTDSDCDVVYFGEDDSVIRTDELRTTSWQKSKDKRDAIGYYFGVTKALAQLDKNIKKLVTRQTKDSTSSCETSTPSGRCSLKDFPAA